MVRSLGYALTGPQITGHRLRRKGKANFVPEAASGPIDATSLGPEPKANGRAETVSLGWESSVGQDGDGKVQKEELPETQHELDSSKPESVGPPGRAEHRFLKEHSGVQKASRSPERSGEGSSTRLFGWQASLPKTSTHPSSYKPTIASTNLSDSSKATSVERSENHPGLRRRGTFSSTVKRQQGGVERDAVEVSSQQFAKSASSLIAAEGTGRC